MFKMDNKDIIKSIMDNITEEILLDIAKTYSIDKNKIIENYRQGKYNNK